MADPTPSARSASCPRCGLPVDPLDSSYLLNGQPAHVMCPLPEAS